MKKLILVLFLFTTTISISENVSDSLVYVTDETFIDGQEYEKEIGSSLPSYNKPSNAASNAASSLLTANKFLALLFGIPDKENATFGDFAVNATPVTYIAPFFKWLVELSLFTLAIVFLITGLRASIDTAREYEFMGKNISTPFVAVRVAIALLFILPMPGGYTTLQTFILYSSYQISKVNTLLYSEVIDKVINVDSFKVKSSAGAPFITRLEYSRLLTIALCQREFKEELNSNISFALSSGADNPVYNQSRGRTSSVKGYGFYGYKNFWGTDGLSYGVRKGACGAFVYSTTYPKPPTNDGSVFMDLNSYIGIIITRMAASYSSVLESTIVNLSLPSSNGTISLKAIANKLVSNKEYKEEDLKLDFDKSWIEINRILSQGFNVANVAVISRVSSMLESFKLEVKKQGWIMAGANLFRMASLQSLLSSLSNTHLIIYDLDRTVIKESAVNDIKGYEERVVVAIDLTDNGNGTAYTATINKVDSRAFSEVTGIQGLGAACSLQGFNDDCLGDAYIQQAINLSKDLMSNEGIHPLTYFNAYGVNGFDDVKSSLILATLGTMSGKAVGYAFQSSSFTIFQVIGHSINDGLDRVYNIFSMLYKSLGAIFLIFAYYLPIAVLIAWIIVVADWAITLYIMLFTSPLFAVFHGMPQGHGFTSEYAQRGYPALLGALFMPFFMLAGLFVYLITAYVVFMFVGAALYISLSHIKEISNVGAIESAFIWLIVLGIMVYVNNMLITIITNFVDRVLRTLGVHEALTSNATHMDTYHSASNDSQKAADAQAQLTAPVNPEGGVGRQGAYKSGQSSHSSDGSVVSGSGGSTSNAHTKASNDAVPPAGQGYNPETNKVESVGENPGAKDSGAGNNPNSGDVPTSREGYNPETNKVESVDASSEAPKSPEKSPEESNNPSSVLAHIKAGVVGALGGGREVMGSASNKPDQNRQNQETQRQIDERLDKDGDNEK